jgi:hypothetical protein
MTFEAKRIGEYNRQKNPRQSATNNEPTDHLGIGNRVPAVLRPHREFLQTGGKLCVKHFPK